MNDLYLAYLSSRLLALKMKTLIVGFQHNDSDGLVSLCSFFGRCFEMKWFEASELHTHSLRLVRTELPLWRVKCRPRLGWQSAWRKIGLWHWNDLYIIRVQWNCRDPTVTENPVLGYPIRFFCAQNADDSFKGTYVEISQSIHWDKPIRDWLPQ